jgi:hypothetical protein
MENLIAFANITSAEKEKVRRHAPATVVPFVVSAGGGVTEATDNMFPAPTGRNGITSGSTSVACWSLSGSGSHGVVCVCVCVCMCSHVVWWVFRCAAAQ